MLMLAQMAVQSFHRKFNCYLSNKPSLLPRDVKVMRQSLILEEMQELFEAMDRGDMVGIADGIADLLYVTLGCAVGHGLEMAPIFAAVHNANMAKSLDKRREDGKILKPEGWVPPDIAGELKRQGWHE